MNPRAVAGIFVAGVLAAGAAVAQSASTRVAAQSDWSIFVEQKPKQCWVVSAPKKTVNTTIIISGWPTAHPMPIAVWR